jgi:hypothetical protein
VEEWPQLRSLGVHDCGTLAEQLGPVRLPRLERLVVYQFEWARVRYAFLQGFAALRPAIPALRAVELQSCFCGNYGCKVFGCAHPAALLAKLRAAWPGLELRRFEEEDWTQA